MERLEAIEKAAAAVASLPPKERTQEVNRLLRGKLTLDQLKTGDGMELLHRRALLITLLSQQKVWPA